MCRASRSGGCEGSCVTPRLPLPPRAPSGPTPISSRIVDCGRHGPGVAVCRSSVHPPRPRSGLDGLTTCERSYFGDYMKIGLLFRLKTLYFYSMSQQPKYIKTILCLANSRKMSGRCIAGKEIAGGETGAWIRPVSAREHEEISENDRRYEDGHTASLLQIFSIPMLKPKPGTYQSENHLIDDRFYWSKSDNATWVQIEKAIDPIDGTERFWFRAD
jgi:putative nucleic acid modification protein with dual OB domain